MNSVAAEKSIDREEKAPPLPRRAAHLPRRLFRLRRPPKSSTTPATENLSTSGPQVSLLLSDRTIRFILSALAIIIYMFLCGYPPSPSKTPIPKSNSRVRTGTRFLVTPNPLSGVSLLSIHSTVPPPTRLYMIPGLPPPTHRPTSISPLLSDRIGVLGQSGVVQSAVSGLPTDLRQRVGRARRVAVNGRRGRGRGRGRSRSRMTLVKVMLCLVLLNLPSLAWKKNLGDFLTLFRVK